MRLPDTRSFIEVSHKPHGTDMYQGEIPGRDPEFEAKMISNPALRLQMTQTSKKRQGAPTYDE